MNNPPNEPSIGNAPSRSASYMRYVKLISTDLQAHSFSELELAILDKRLFATEPLTCDALGEQFELSRARVSQVEQGVRNLLRTLTNEHLAFLSHRPLELGRHILTERDLDKNLTTLVPQTWESIHDRVAAGAIRAELFKALRYRRHKGYCISPEATDILREIGSAVKLLSDDIGLVQESILRRVLPDRSWHHYWEDLVGLAGLFRCNNFLAVKDTQKARVKAAVLSLGRPATRDEIAETSGLTPRQVAAQLPLLDDIVRADRTRWGLREWIDDEYEGIPKEIIQRIREGGGEAPLDRLLNEIPKRFDVKQASVQAVLESRQFRTELGRVRIVDPRDLVLDDLDDVIDGLDTDGSPFWTFVVRQEHLRGYSVQNVPPEFILAVGGRANERVPIPVLEPAGSRDVSAIWRLASLSDGEFGRIRDALDRLGAQPGDTVRVVIVDGASLAFQPETDDANSNRQSRFVAPRDSITYADRTQPDSRCSGVKVMPAISACLGETPSQRITTRVDPRASSDDSPPTVCSHYRAEN